jgi:hypothetical protein
MLCQAMIARWSTIACFRCELIATHTAVLGRVRSDGLGWRVCENVVWCVGAER